MSRASKFLSLILRHEPHRVGVTLDENGWTDVDALLAGLAANGLPLTRDELFAIVRDSDKQRFALSEDQTRIRANQGHSVQIELDLPDATPPARLYHGTYADAIASIHATGLAKGQRHAVHMAAETDTASKVGMRKGAPVILTIRADEMVAEGIKFQQSANGVWLTEHVPARFIDFPSEAERPEWRHWAGSGAKPRVQIAGETERAVEAGWYTAPSGARVSIAATTELARHRTVMYEADAVLQPATKKHATTFAVVNESTNQSIARLLSRPDPGHVCALNFASAKNPGGGWRGGARAQEESIARTSSLVHCLESQPRYYERNRAMKSAMYLDLVLFSPYVPFFRDDDGAWLERPLLASIVTAAAPNASALRQHGARSSIDEAELEATLRRRARLALDVCVHHHVDRLILGAWGAGVFGNDPDLIADCFAQPLLGDLAGAFVEVVFAILGGPGAANYDAFAKRFPTVEIH
ncbi:MAG: TIGR02452 family protein [Kofleriaceae bacterium]